MSTTILSPRPDDRPPQREDWGTGVTISVIAHAALIAALFWGVHWRSNDQPEGTTAELWSAVPLAAAPPPVTTPAPPPPVPAPTPEPAPPPPPPVAATPKPPDIVIEQEKEKQKKLQEQREQEQELKDKLAKEKADKAKADQAKADADKKAQAQKQLDAKQLAKIHDENMRRMMGQLDAPANSTGTAARNSGPSANYGGRIAATVRRNITVTDTIVGNPQTIVSVTCAPDGRIIGRRIKQSSGSPEWDDIVLRAIDKTAVLPRDVDGSIPSPMDLAFRPQDKQ